MTSKNFYWNGNIENVIIGKYNDIKDQLGKSTGSPIEYQLHNIPYCQIQGWHNIEPVDRVKIIADMLKIGLIEGEEI